jgi:TPR repeat protein
MKSHRNPTLLVVMVLGCLVACGEMTVAQTPVGPYNGNFAELKAKAEAGDAIAQGLLGRRYETGEGVAKDFVEAVKWHRKAAGQGFAVSQTSLGRCYAEGKGVGKDTSEAVKWYRNAAEQGFSAAQSMLGTCYDEGNGVEQNASEAVKWHRKAAEQGFSLSQDDLGLHYVTGAGVTRDYLEAYVWWTLSYATTPGERLRANLAALVKRMSSDEISEGQRRVREFKAKRAVSAH